VPDAEIFTDIGDSMSAKRDSTRFARVHYGVTVIWSWIKDVLVAFFDLRREDGVLGSGKKVARLAFRRIAYFIADWMLVAVSAALVGFMKWLDVSFFWTFVALWAFDYASAWYFVYYYEKTGEDMSLAQDFRRVTDALHKRSKLAGIFSAALPIGLAIIWSGPERIVLFFRKEIGTLTGVTLWLLLLTEIQAAFWAWAYGLGYDLALLAF
jgi:hypothetical protein